MATGTRRPRTVHVEHRMGTVFTIDVRDAGDWTAPIAAVVGWLREVDQVFSTYRPDSVINRVGRAELALEECPGQVGEVLQLCVEAQTVSRGYFTALRDGRLDPTGLVKGWAIERASILLRAAGSDNHAVSGGGDMQLAGCAAAGSPWRVGIADPLHAGQLLTTVAGSDLALATSGTAERGAHIVNPFTGRPASRLASLTVVGPHLTTVDAYATAAFAMGDAAREWLESLPDHDGFAVTSDGETWATAGFPARTEPRS